MESDRAIADTLRDISVTAIRRMLSGVAEDISTAAPENLRDTLRQAVDRVELSPDDFEAVIHLRFGPASKSGDLLATPRGFEPRFIP